MARTAKTEMMDVISYSFELKTRRIYFGKAPAYTASDDELTDFSEHSVDLAIKLLHRMEDMYKSKPIEIHVNSPGGDFYQFLRLADAIQCLTCQVIFVGSGLVASSAAYLMSVCDVRRLHKSTTVMLHEVRSGSTDGSSTDMSIDGDEVKRLRDLGINILVSNSRMSKEFWGTVCQRDLHLTPKECIELGIADEIIEYKKRGNLRKKRSNLLSREIDGKVAERIVKKLYSRVGLGNFPNVIVETRKPEPTDDNIVVDISPVPEFSESSHETSRKPLNISKVEENGEDSGKDD